MGRSPCCQKNGLKKGPWTPEEDQKLIDYIQKHGYGNWRTLPKNAGLQRCGKSCRLRWTNYLRPDIKRGRFSFEEEETIIQLHSVMGNKWSAIAARLPGRTDNEIKNYWNTHIRKKLLRMGIDPVTHNPRLDLLDLSSILSSSLYNSSHMNISRLLGLQVPLVNQELLTLATSLLSNSQNQNPNSSSSSSTSPLVQQNHLIICNPKIDHTQMPQFYNNSDDHNQIVQTNFPNCDNQFSSNSLGEFGKLNEWQSNGSMGCNLEGDYYGGLGNYGYINYDDNCNYNYASDQNSNFQSISSSNNFSFGSGLSTPANSNSTYINSINSPEEERESYCSDMLKFEIPDFLGVNELV